MLAALDHTDQLLLICNPEVTSLKNVRIGLETIDRLGFDRERVSLVANRIGAAGAPRVATRSSMLSMPRSRTSFPMIAAVPAAVNRAVPVVVSTEDGPCSRAVARLGSSVFAQAPAEAPRERRSAASFCGVDDERRSIATDSRGRGDASVLAERLQVDVGSVRRGLEIRTPS